MLSLQGRPRLGLSNPSPFQPHRSRNGFLSTHLQPKRPLFRPSFGQRRTSTNPPRFQQIPNRLSQQDLYRPIEPPKRSSYLSVLLAAGLAAIVLLIADKLRPKKKKKSNRPKVVVIGSGWAGLSCVKEIDTSEYDVVLISPRDYFLFTPLLNDVTVGKVDTSCVAEPIHKYLDRFEKSDVTFYEASCNDVDPVRKTVKCKAVDGGAEFSISYDKLILAVGASVNTFGIKGVEQNCHFLKDIKDTRAIRDRILGCFEMASIPNQSQESIKKNLHFVVVGGGPTSVQFVSELHNLFHDLEKFYPELIKEVQVTFVNTKEQIKNTYDGKISEYYMKHEFKKACKDMVVTESRIKAVEKDAIVLEKEGKLPFGACIWLTGVRPNELVLKLISKKPAIQHNKAALITNDFLQVKGFDEIYAIGECGTIDQARILHRWMDVFKTLDENKDGFIDAKEFQNLTDSFSRQFPQLLEFNKQASTLFEQADVNKDGKLTADEFQTVLKTIDSVLTSLPSTAQTAQQQGVYLGRALNKILREDDLVKLFNELDEDKSGKLDIKEVRKGLKKLKIPVSKRELKEFMEASDTNKDGTIDLKEFIHFALKTQQQGGTGDWKKLSHAKILPFRYKHLGGFEYVGYDFAVTERGSKGKSIIDGFGAWWMWRSIFTTELLSGRSKVQLGVNWILTCIYGRNFTRY